MSFKGYFHCLYAILPGHRKKHSTILKNLGSITKVFLLASTLKRKNLSGMSLWSHADRKVFAIIQSSRVFIPIHMLNYSKVSKSLNKKQSQRFSEVERVKSNYRYCLHPIGDGCLSQWSFSWPLYTSLTNYKFSYLVIKINQKRATKFNLRSVKPSVSVQFVMLEPTQNKLKILLSIQMK